MPISFKKRFDNHQSVFFLNEKCLLLILIFANYQIISIYE